MKKKWVKYGIIATVVALLTAGIAVFAVPGSDGDPLISLSYIETVLLPEIKQYVDEKIDGIQGGSGSNSNAPSFAVVNVKKGKTVICDAGAEIILRGGSATIVATQKGGLADTTSGYDLADGTPMPPNHLLIVPLADGRGFVAETDVIVMIKGGYKLK